MSHWKIEDQCEVKLQYTLSAMDSPTIEAQSKLSNQSEPTRIQVEFHPSSLSFSCRSQGSKLETNISILDVSATRASGELNGELFVDFYRPSSGPLRHCKQIQYRPHAPGIDKILEDMKSQPHTVCSPLTGNVLKVLVKTGEMVTKGDTLCIIEAMKMENAISAPISGKLGTMSCKESENITAKSLITVITPSQEA